MQNACFFSVYGIYYIHKMKQGNTPKELKMKGFTTKVECKAYIEKHGLAAMPMPRYSEDDGELLYWYIYYLD